MNRNGTVVDERKFGTGYYLRPNMVQFYKCTNVFIEGVTLLNAPMGNVHTIRSEIYNY